jgi:hypothetical protein
MRSVAHSHCNRRVVALAFRRSFVQNIPRIRKSVNSENAVISVESTEPGHHGLSVDGECGQGETTWELSAPSSLYPLTVTLESEPLGPLLTPSSSICRRGTTVICHSRLLCTTDLDVLISHVEAVNICTKYVLVNRNFSKYGLVLYVKQLIYLRY